MSPTFGDVVEEVQALDHESKEELMDLLRAWLIEERREEILQGAKADRSDYEKGLTKSGSPSDLMADLYAED